ncbi:M56 family metallopeptidase [uncultured Flavonifractor sp.]|uniref:M56 family metallopeptidase n=1 Tax=uncultured Flavonifractor sp. TaxID=1193534 RepID=UPI0026254942|nr:M56 family metallopeptidase [uncultured Flavonifractor sp.]
MNGSWLFYRLLLGLTCGAVFAVALRWRSEGGTPLGKKKSRYAPYFSYWLLPLLLLFELLLFPVLEQQGKGGVLPGILFQVFLQLAVYDGVLLLLLPLLRRWLRPETCVVLWLLPNYLYLAQQSLIQPSRPLLVLSIPGWAMPIICLIWLAGFVGVLGWKILSHLRFRRHILQDARLVTDPPTSKLWQDLRDWAGVGRKKYPLVTSPHVTAPLSVGLFASTIQVVLPERDYSREELDLILRHELIHIGRGDSSAKFFLAFCSALCWFNPLVWAAMARGAEELELNCDQEVLNWAGEERGEEYARLLLRTAGEQAGFTTCLSASAASLRYRLRQVLHPVERGLHSGVAGLAIFALILTGGLVSLDYDAGTVQEVLSRRGTREISGIEQIYRFHDSRNGSLCRADSQQVLLDYVEGLKLRSVAGFVSYESGGEELWLECRLDGEDYFRLVVQDNLVHIYPVNRPYSPWSYRVAGEVDWTWLDSRLTPE